MLTGKKSLQEFPKAYKAILNITKPPNAHIVLAHIEQYIVQDSKYKGLGFYSKQTGEAIHRKFDDIYSKYKMKNIFTGPYGLRLWNAVVEFSSTHI